MHQEWSLGAALLQVMDNVNCQYDKVLDNVMFRLIAFISMSLSSREW